MLAPPLYRKRLRQAAGTVTTVSIPAPMGGLNTIDPGYGMPETDCPLLYNMVGAENGLRCRLGSREWCTNLTGLVDNEVRTILPFSGSTTASDKLFACTSTGIWDVTASSQAPSQVVGFSKQTGNAGYGTACVFVNFSGGHFLLYCDEENGYLTYSEANTAWNNVGPQASIQWVKNTVYNPADQVINNGLT
jgi:hypothetical protein